MDLVLGRDRPESGRNALVDIGIAQGGAWIERLGVTINEQVIVQTRMERFGVLAVHGRGPVVREVFPVIGIVDPRLRGVTRNVALANTFRQQNQLSRGQNDAGHREQLAARRRVAAGHHGIGRIPALIVRCARHVPVQADARAVGW